MATGDFKKAVPHMPKFQPATLHFYLAGDADGSLLRVVRRNINVVGNKPEAGIPAARH